MGGLAFHQGAARHARTSRLVAKRGEVGIGRGAARRRGASTADRLQASEARACQQYAACSTGECFTERHRFRPVWRHARVNVRCANWRNNRSDSQTERGGETLGKASLFQGQTGGLGVRLNFSSASLGYALGSTAVPQYRSVPAAGTSYQVEMI